VSRKCRAKKIEGATAVKLVAPSNCAVKFLTLSISSGGVTAVRLVPPFKPIRKGLRPPVPSKGAACLTATASADGKEKLQTFPNQPSWRDRR